MWRHIEEWHSSRPGKPTWSDDTLQAAKALGRGEPATLDGKNFSTGIEQPQVHFARINALRLAGVPISPADDFKFDAGKQDLSGDIDRSHAILSHVIGSNQATGQSLHEALRAYQEAIKVEYKDSTDGLLSDNGKTKID